MFQIGDFASFLAGGLTCIPRGDLFVSWSGGRLRPDSIKFGDSVEKESPNFLWFKIAKEYIQKPKKISMYVAHISHLKIPFTFILNYLKNLKTILRNSRLLDQFFSWVISTLEQANTQTMSVKRATPL